MRLISALVLAVSLLAFGCAVPLKQEDKTLLENSLKAADEAKVTCQQSADRASGAASKAEAAASSAASSADRAQAAVDKSEMAAEKCEKMFEKRLYK
ncbi:secreted protein [Candidatus Magnetoovum chiemensis]|nr:secreted protein [Candidatus Magnetoovum chiemensis]